MVLCRNTTFQGISINRLHIGSPILADDLLRIAKDQAMVYELLTGKNADGSGGASTNTAHRHTEQNNLIYLPLLTQMFGDESAYQHRDSALGAYSWTNDLAVISGGAAAIVSGVVTWYAVVNVPVGWSGREWECRVKCLSAFMTLALTVETAVGTVDNNQANIPFRHIWTQGEPGSVFVYGAERDRMVWRAPFTPTSAGLLLLKITCTTQTSSTVQIFAEISVVPNITRPYDGNAPRKPDASGSNVVMVGDPENSNAWQPIDSALCANSGAYGTVIAMLASNDALLQELMTGYAAAGNASLTVASGHDHEGSGNRGVEMDVPVGAWVFGPYYNPGAPGTYTVFSGNGFTPPVTGSSTWATVFSFTVRTPYCTNNAWNTSKLKAAFIGYEENSKAANIQVRITTNGDGAHAQTYTGPAGGTDHYCLLQDNTKVLPFTSGGYTTVLVELRDAGNSGTNSVSLNGMVLYIRQA